jgi:hypothetical protein
MDAIITLFGKPIQSVEDWDRAIVGLEVQEADVLVLLFRDPREPDFSYEQSEAILDRANDWLVRSLGMDELRAARLSGRAFARFIARQVPHDLQTARLQDPRTYFDHTK